MYPPKPCSKAATVDSALLTRFSATGSGRFLQFPKTSTLGSFHHALTQHLWICWFTCLIMYLGGRYKLFWALAIRATVKYAVAAVWGSYRTDGFRGSGRPRYKLARITINTTFGWCRSWIKSIGSRLNKGCLKES